MQTPLRLAGLLRTKPSGQTVQTSRNNDAALSNALKATNLRRAMHIQSIPMWTGSSNNYAYVVKDDRTSEAVVIDPANEPEVTPVLRELIDSKGLKLTSIINTHHHWDHAGGNSKIVRRVPPLAAVKGPRTVPSGQLTPKQLAKFPGLDVIGGKDCEAVKRTPKHGETFKIGDSISVQALHTPCHTQDSICWYMRDGDEKVVFTGDTLFIGGCGRFFEGTPEEMHRALNETLSALPDDTKVFPGHEYTRANTKFLVTVLQSEPVKKLQAFAEANQETQGKFTIGDEKVSAAKFSPNMQAGVRLTQRQLHNAFMRVQDPVIQEATGETDPVKVMASLREMKNRM